MAAWWSRQHPELLRAAGFSQHQARNPCWFLLPPGGSHSSSSTVSLSSRVPGAQAALHLVASVSMTELGLGPQDEAMPVQAGAHPVPWGTPPSPAVGLSSSQLQDQKLTEGAERIPLGCLCKSVVPVYKPQQYTIRAVTHNQVSVVAGHLSDSFSP